MDDTGISYLPVRDQPIAYQAIDCLIEAARDRYSPNVFKDVSEKYNPIPPVCWPSTITDIDKLCGGFYGLTTLAAEEGTGKTMIALGSAIEAAASGKWQVRA